MNEIGFYDPDALKRLEKIFEKETLERIGNSINRDMVEFALQKTYSFAKLMSYYRCAMMEIETKFNVLNEEFSLMFDRQPINSVKSRLKNPVSIQQKLMKKGYAMTTENIENCLNDVAGIRVICSFLDDVYMLADALKKQDDIEVIQEKDYIKDPKPNGYRSLHIIVSVPIFLQQEKRVMKAEVQLRTIAMDSWASLEHQLHYKKDNTFDEEMEAELKRCADLSAELDRSMDQLRTRVYSGRKSEAEASGIEILAAVAGHFGDDME